jgi:hypothetical protein
MTRSLRAIILLITFSCLIISQIASAQMDHFDHSLSTEYEPVSSDAWQRFLLDSVSVALILGGTYSFVSGYQANRLVRGSVAEINEGLENAIRYFNADDCGYDFLHRLEPESSELVNRLRTRVQEIINRLESQTKLTENGALLKTELQNFLKNKLTGTYVAKEDVKALGNTLQRSLTRGEARMIGGELCAVVGAILLVLTEYSYANANDTIYALHKDDPYNFFTCPNCGFDCQKLVEPRLGAITRRLEERPYGELRDIFYSPSLSEDPLNYPVKNWIVRYFWNRVSGAYSQSAVTERHLKQAGITMASVAKMHNQLIIEYKANQTAIGPDGLAINDSLRAKAELACSYLNDYQQDISKVPVADQMSQLPPDISRVE